MRLTLLLLAPVAVLAGCSSSSATPSARHATARPRPTSDGLVYTIPGAKNGGTPRPTANPHVTIPVPASLKTATPSAPTRLPAGAFTATVFGTVQSTSHKPLAGAMIQVADGQRTARSDASGRYQIAFPSKLIASLQVQKRGYQCGMAMSTGTIKSGQRVRKDWSCVRVIPNHPVPPPFPSFVGTPVPGMKSP